MRSYIIKNRYNIILLLIVSIISCKSELQNNKNDSEINYRDTLSISNDSLDNIIDTIMTEDTTLLIFENMKYKFQILRNGPESYNEIEKIHYSQSNNFINPKSINFKDKEYFIFMEFEDYNFDGYLDLYLKNGCAILNNCSGCIYLFNPEHNEFKHNEQFDTLTTVTVNKKKQEIYSINRSQAGASFQKGVFKMKNHKLKIIRYVIQEQDGDDWFFQITTFDVSGKSKVIKREINKYPVYTEDEKKF